MLHLCSGYEDNATVNMEVQILSLRSFLLLFNCLNIKEIYSAKKKNTKKKYVALYMNPVNRNLKIQKQLRIIKILTNTAFSITKKVWVVQ